MIPNSDIATIFKFGEQKWIKLLVEGSVSFSCSGNFAYQAIKTGNDIQGDRYDGIFAKLSNNDSRIGEMKKRLGYDLEIFTEGEYTYLRRKSAKLKPIFCAYGYTAGDIMRDGKISKCGSHTVRHDFDEKMYSGFSNSLACPNVISEPFRFTQVMIQAAPFVDRFKIAARQIGLKYEWRPIDYTQFEQDTFFIEPTDKYDELFCKFPKYKYQHEIRICLYELRFISIFDRFNLKVLPLNSNDYRYSHIPIYLETKIKVGRVE